MSNTTTTSKGNLLGGILLIAGCCIGAGMLGLPVLSARAGFQPSLVMFLICWLFMICTGFLVLEVNLWYKDEISIITMAERTLGLTGKAIAWFVFLFLFYSLMVAYVAASGNLISEFLADYFQIYLPESLGSLAFCCLFGVLLYLGTGAVDWFNRILMIGLIVAYAGLIIVGYPHVKNDFLEYKNWNYATAVIPVVIVSFGFHNLIPSLTTYFRRDVKSLKWAIFIGSLIPFLVYVIWEWLILGIVPVSEFSEALNQGEIATEALKDATGATWIVDIAQAFAFFAIMTSFLSVALSFVDFLADGFKIEKTPAGKAILAFLVVIPPLICALVYPTIFLSALNAAGGFGTMILFGILPAMMVWKGRYSQKLGLQELVPGGKGLLFSIILISVCVMLLQLI